MGLEQYLTPDNVPADLQYSTFACRAGKIFTCPWCGFRMYSYHYLTYYGFLEMIAVHILDHQIITFDKEDAVSCKDCYHNIALERVGVRGFCSRHGTRTKNPCTKFLKPSWVRSLIDDDSGKILPLNTPVMDMRGEDSPRDEENMPKALQIQFTYSNADQLPIGTIAGAMKRDPVRYPTPTAVVRKALELLEEHLADEDRKKAPDTPQCLTAMYRRSK